MLNSREHKISFFISLALHVSVIAFMLFTFEKTIKIPQNLDFDPNKPIIHAVMVPQKSLKKPQEAIADVKETAEIERERLRERVQEKEKKREEKAALDKAKALAEQKVLEEKKQADLLALEKLKEAEKKEKEKKEKERQEAVRVKKEKEALEAKKKQDEVILAKKKALEKQAQLEKERDELLRQAEARKANVPVNHDELMRHGRLIQNRVNQYWRQPIGFDIDGLHCKVTVRLLPTGEVIDVVILESSGSLEFDRSAELAVRKASPLPMPQNPSIANEFRQFNFTFRPEAV